ncbi:c-type cytochrome biogenesis protein CcsB [Actinomadura roseirufa]|uniref:c-type cytochrome biogenesis protein CcsB n=1 Tax=Actinomadura roseirufa TaxID=2094049 RepID=UPI001F5F0B92|nr:c-type cytochrome biogenesis protein CcsB [Actinomadura roseirufa]
MGNADLANLSDKLMLTTVVLYIIALFAYAADLGFGRRGEPAAALEKAEAKVLVAAGSAGAEGGAVETAGEAPAEPGAREAAGRRVDWVRLAVLLNVLGWASHLGVLVSRGLAAGRWPWANMYEFLTAISFAAVTAFLVVMWRYNARFLGAFVMAAAVLALGIANLWLYDSVGPVSPALNSYWIAIHVTAAITSTGAFTVAGTATVLYLLKIREQGGAGSAGEGTGERAAGRAAGLLARIPSADTLDRLSMRVTTFAFPIWTATIIMGAIWADEAWGRYWGWDPKEIWSFVTWVLYAAYLHARATAGWKGRKAAVLSLVAFAALLFNFFGVNYLFSGLHSYA